MTYICIVERSPRPTADPPTWAEPVAASLRVGALQLLVTQQSRLKQAELLVEQELHRFEEELAMIRAEDKGLVPVERQLSVMELQRVKEAKMAVLDELKAGHANEDAFGLNWDTPANLERARIIRGEIRQVNDSISKLA